MRRPQRHGGRLAAPAPARQPPGLLAEALLAGPGLRLRRDPLHVAKGVEAGLAAEPAAGAGRLGLAEWATASSSTVWSLI